MSPINVADSDDDNDDYNFSSIFPPQNAADEGRTVIHGIYPKFLRQQSPFAFAASALTERRTKFRSRAQNRYAMS